MGFIASTILLLGTDRKSHGQKSGLLEKFHKQSRDSLPPYLQSAVPSEYVPYNLRYQHSIEETMFHSI